MIDQPSRNEVVSRWPSTAFLAITSILFLLYCSLLATKSMSGFPPSMHPGERWPWLGDRPVGEDGFYMLSVAYNLAATHHLVYTYDMPATGIQPLATLVFAGLAAVTRHFTPDRWVLVRVMICFGSTLFLLFSWMMAYLASGFASAPRRRLVFGLAYSLTLLDFTAFRLFTYGLETGIYLCLLAVCFIVWKKMVLLPRIGWTDLLLFGLCAGFAGLARIDFGLCLVILLLFLLVNKRINVIQLLVTGLIALVCVSPWFFFVHKVSGHWLPSSGKAESSFIDSQDAWTRLTRSFLAAVAHLCPWSFAGSMNLATGVFGVTSLILLVFLYRSTRRVPDMPLVKRFHEIFTPWIAAFVTLALVYLFFFWSTHFYTRYSSPLLIVSLPLLALALGEQPFVQRRPWAVFVVLAIIFCSWDVLAFHRGRVYSNMITDAGYIHNWYPNTRVGAFQSGTLGYFDPNVENLDGKLNQGALIASQSHTLPQFIDSEKINVLIDWPSYIRRLPSDYLRDEWKPCPHPLPGTDSMCLVRAGLEQGLP